MFLISLGPFLTVYGNKTIIPLPGYIIAQLPILKGMRCMSRITIMGMLCLSVFIAWVCSMVVLHSKRKNLIMIILGSLMILEYMTTPFELSRAIIPEIYYKIAREKGDFTVLDIPLEWYIVGTTFSSPEAHRSQYYQVIHNKQILAGCISRGSSAMVDQYLENPFFEKIYQLQKGSSPTKFSKKQDKKEIINTIKFFKIRYIVFREPYINSPVQKYFEKELPVKIEKIYEKDGITAYKVPEITGKIKDKNYYDDIGRIVNYKYGWAGRELWGGQFHMRWSLGKDSFLEVFIEEKADYKIRMKLLPFPFKTVEQTVKIYINGKFLCRQRLDSEWRDYSVNVPAKYWLTGKNEIKFHYSKTTTPKSVLRGSTDNRRLAAALSSFRIEKQFSLLLTD